MATNKKARQKVAGVKPKADKKNPKTAQEGAVKKSSTKKKSLKQKTIAKPPPRENVILKKTSAKKVAKKKVVVASRVKTSKNNAKMDLKKSKTAKPAKILKKPGKAVVGKSKKPSAPDKAPKAIQPVHKPLDPVFAKIRQGLLASRAELFKMVVSSQELERNVSELTFSNEIDLASSLEGREMVFQLASRDRNGLKLIDDALFKLTHGTYGICEACSKPIGIKRLQILPLTQFCIECQENMEHAS